MRVRYSRRTVDIDERAGAEEEPQALVRRLAREKAQQGMRETDCSLPVLGADTVVCLGQEVFDKPADSATARRTLERLSGIRHEVLTAVCLVTRNDCVQALSRNYVTFRKLESREIANYLESGESEGKAGAYAIQGLAAMFIEKIEGSYSGIMGLPIFETAQLLRSVGIEPLAEVGFIHG